MFKDYYKILNVTFSASDAEIKRAYREMSIRWHPDKNPDIDVTAIMQDINEAYAILKDAVKRARYDEEYQRFCGSFKTKEPFQEDLNTEEEQPHYDWNYEYNVQDDYLKEDIKNARKYAKELVEEFLNELKKSSKAAAKGAATTAFNYVIAWVAAGIIIAIIGSLIRACN